MDRRITVGILIALPIMFLLGMVLFAYSGNNNSTPTAQPTQEPVSSGLKTVYVEGIPVAIKPDSRQLILESEPPPLYAIGVPAPVDTPIPTAPNTSPTLIPGQQIVQVTQIIEITKIIEVTKVIEVTATPEFGLPQDAPTATPVPAPNPDTSSDVRLENYTVRPGDTLSRIASREGIDFNLLVEYNGYRDWIYPEDVIVLPRVGSASTPFPRGITCGGDDRQHTVELNDTVYSLSIEYGTSVDAIRLSNGLGFNYLIYPNQELCIPR